MLIQLIKDIGNIKSLIRPNLNNIFGDIERNRKILDLPLYKIICFEGYEMNKEILENAQPTDEKNQKLFDYFLTREYKFLLYKYYNNDNGFSINGELINVSNFKTIDEVLENKFKNKSLIDRKIKISNIKTMTEIILDDSYYYCEEKDSKDKKNGLYFKTISIERFDNYVDIISSFLLREIDDFNYIEFSEDN